ncbi:MAG: ADP-forming succinate--CoA ligase subunit beta [Candidatus Marinimicrobia bacterium]|nr:ADP-forming succinate--CoA ligase subunit beta [Candidatus Neomarinimicrobiota bacterium]
MKIHEYQAKELLKESGVPVPKGNHAFTVDEADEVAKNLKTELIVVKAQIHAGGRGKGGGVKLAHSFEEVKQHASNILGMTLITHQTGPEGKVVRRLLVEEGVAIATELYAGIVLDRSKNQFVFMVSTEGGVEIEKVAAQSPEKIIKEWIDPGLGLTDFQARNLAYSLGLAGDQAKNASKTFLSLWNAFEKSDCSLAEINPLVVTESGNVLALDAKMNFDDNALYRQPQINEMRDLSEELESEIEASKHNLNYIKLGGNVGCMVNGAGLAMATMDIIKLSGGEPANFLDVGGVASAETVARGFQIILSDPAVKSILINIFGGIVRCDRVAQGVIDALSQMDVEVPVIIRLEGTNAKEAANLLENSDLDFIVATSFQDGAEKAVRAAIRIES